MALFLRLLCCLLFATSVFAAEGDPVPVPPLTGRVVDLAGLLQPRQTEDLSRLLAQFEEKHGSQIAVLILPTTAPEAIEQFSIRVFDSWKLGRKQYNDGILIVVAVKDRKLRIDTGYGLEGAIPDAIAKRIVMETISPKFRAGDPYGGLVSGVEQIERLIAGERLPPASQGGQGAQSSQGSQGSQGGQDGQFGQLLVIGLVAASVIGGILSLILGRFFGGLATGGLVAVIAWFLSGSILAAMAAAVMVFFFVLLNLGRGVWGGGLGGGGSWGGGGGGGGFSGGGGSAGGGGASGDW